MTKTAPCCDKSAGRGRPPDPGKREAIIEAASRLFLDQGYNVSMETIAAEAGVSKQTIYNLFSTKEDLFGVIVASRSESVLAPLQPLLDDVDTLGEDTNPRGVLMQFAHQFLIMMTSECVTKVHGIILPVDASTGRTALRDFFYENGPMRTLNRFSEYLAHQHERGTLRVPDPDLAAESLFGMLNGFIPLRNTLGIPNDLTEEMIEKKARYCVDAFLRTHGTGNETTSD